MISRDRQIIHRRKAKEEQGYVGDICLTNPALAGSYATQATASASNVLDCSICGVEFERNGFDTWAQPCNDREGAQRQFRPGVGRPHVKLDQAQVR